MQLFVDIIFLASSAALSGLAFYPIVISNRAFILSAALAYMVGGYAYWIVSRSGASVPIAALLALVSASVLSGVLDLCCISPIRKARILNWKLLVVTLGMLIIGQNVFAALFGDDPIPLMAGRAETTIALGGAYFSRTRLATIIAAFVVANSVWFIYYRTDIGRTIRAIFSNPDLALILGLDPERIRLHAAILGGGIAGLTGILVGLDTGITPMLGFQLLLKGIIVILIGGMSGVFTIVAGSLLLAALESVAAMFLGVAWMDSVAFVLLIAFLICKPLGLGGRRLKKVQI